ncbi:MAG: hypothetical protein QXJ70_04060 [Acidilobaceae archaeon]
MPTVHLAIPESMYNELKSRASEMGIQVTDLIKLYIRLGLDKSIASSGDSEILNALSRKIDKLEKEFKLKITITEGKLREFDETLKYIIERLEMLEDIVSEYKTRKLAEKSTLSS